jgi:hypothetical protein
MNSDWIEREVENCLGELRGICKHLRPPPRRWHTIKERLADWWSDNDVGDVLLGFTVCIGLFVGVPLLVSKCDTKNSSDSAKSPHGEEVAQYTVTYYEDGAQEWEEVDDQ